MRVLRAKIRDADADASGAEESAQDRKRTIGAIHVGSADTEDSFHRLLRSRYDGVDFEYASSVAERSGDEAGEMTGSWQGVDDVGFDDVVDSESESHDARGSREENIPNIAQRFLDARPKQRAYPDVARRLELGVHTVGQSNGTDFVIFDQTWRDARRSQLRLPWEPPPTQLTINLSTPFLGRFESVAGMVPRRDAPPEMLPTSDLRKKRIYATKISKSDDQLRDIAMRKIRHIVLYKLEHSRFGQALMDVAGRLCGEDVMQAVNVIDSALFPESKMDKIFV